MSKQTQNKTQATKKSAADFLSDIPNDQQKKDAQQLNQLMSKITGQTPVMWGPSIVGYNQVHYKYESGREGDMGAIGFSPRKTYITIYLGDGASKYSGPLKKLGPHTTGKVCLYIKRLSDVNQDVLAQIITTSYKFAMAHKHNVPRAE